MRHFVEWKCLPLILSEEIGDEMYYCSQDYNNRFTQNGVASIPNGMSIACFIVIFSTSKKQFPIKWVIAVLSDVLPKPSFLLFYSPSMLHSY